MESTTLSTKFINGLLEYGLDYNTAVKDFKYAGGSGQQRHRNYYKLVFKNDKYPVHKHNCICGQEITENCYIWNGSMILTLGSCCIKRFIPKCGRTCEICDEPHKNRIVNRCNRCRYGLCDICNKKCGTYYTKCYSCTYK